MSATVQGPQPLRELAHDHHPASLGQGLCRMLGLVAPHHHGEERRLLLPAAADCDSEHGPSEPALGVADLGLVGEVAGEAHGCLGHGASPFCCLAGGLPCPWTRGTVDAVAYRESPGGKRWSQRSRPPDEGAGRGRLGCRVGWWTRLRLGAGHARSRPARSLHPGRGGRSRLPPRELLAARLRQAVGSAPGSSRCSRGHRR
jgi:hypothetical protein